MLQIPEQPLEWTYQFREDKEFAVDAVQRCVFSFALLLVAIPFVLLTGWVPYKFSPYAKLGWIVFLILVLGVFLLLADWSKKPGRKLRIDRSTITLTDTNYFGTKERRMTAAGAKVRAVYLDFFERLFTVDIYRMNSAYHIEIARNGETFLFPCTDATQQRQIIKQIEEFKI